MNHPHNSQTASVLDLFCGVGGLSHGFKLEGFSLAGGIDIEESCRWAYERNNGAPFYRLDVSNMRGEELLSYFPNKGRKILVGCAPCQPFSTYNQKNEDPQWQLLGAFARLIGETLPEVVSMENVPALLRFQGGRVFEGFRAALVASGYHVSSQVAFAPDYGVPQRRQRLVLLASRLGPIALIPPTHSPKQYKTVQEAIGNLPPLGAGEMDHRDPLHKASRLSPLNLRRIRQSTPGGSWRDWEPELVAACHQAATGQTYASVYGRMSWDEPSPTITTQFYGFGNGRFGHPEQDRALSIREGAVLQTFPRDYDFVEPKGDISFKKLGKLIGNAVPVDLARAIAQSIQQHLDTYPL